MLKAWGHSIYIIRTVVSKEILESFFFHVPRVFYHAFVGVRSAETHLQPNLYHYLGWKDLSSLLVKAPLSQGRPAYLWVEIGKCMYMSTAKWQNIAGAKKSLVVNSNLLF